MNKELEENEWPYCREERERDSDGILEDRKDERRVRISIGGFLFTLSRLG